MRKYWCYFWTAFITIAGFPIVCLMMLATLSGSASLIFVQAVWARVLLWAGGVTMQVEGKENCDKARPTIYVSNHQSTLDVPLLLQALMPVDFRFVAKKALQYVPVMGWYMLMAGFVFIDRSSRRGSVRSLEAAGEKIRRGTSIVMFPEGTRSENGEILPFKKGPFAVAVAARVPICPVAIEGSYKIMPKNSWDIVPGIARVKIGAPIDPAPFGDDREALATEVRNRIIDLQLQLGGKGGNRNDAIAAGGSEGVGRATRSREEADA